MHNKSFALRKRKNMDGFYERKRWWFGLPWTFTTYEADESILKRRTGLLSTKEETCYLYKIQDVSLQRSLGEKMFGLGTVICYSGDVTSPTLDLKRIKNSTQIRDWLLESCEQARIKRRSIMVQDVGMHAMHDFED